MGRLSLIIGDNDTEYLENFEKFLLINYPQRFELFTFFSADKLSDFLTHVKNADILLLSDHILESGINTTKAKLVLLLTENNTVGTPRGERLSAGSGGQPDKDARQTDGSGRKPAAVSEGIGTVYRYQHMDKLVSEILRLFSDKSNKNASVSGYGSTRIVGVYSPSGGAGSSSIAAGSSILCAGKGIKSFYLNMEAIPSTDLFFRGECSQTFSNVIYYLKGNYSNLQLRLEGAKCIDTKSGVHYFRPPENICEFNELTDQDVATLISELKRSAFYRYIFVDMSAGLNSVNSTILQLADCVLLVFAPDRRTMMKFTNLKAGLDLLESKGGTGLMDRVIPVLNRANAKNGHFKQQITWPGVRPLTQIVDYSLPNVVDSDICADSAVHVDSAVAPVESKSFLTALNRILENLSSCSTTEATQRSGGEHIA